MAVTTNVNDMRFSIEAQKIREEIRKTYPTLAIEYAQKNHIFKVGRITWLFYHEAQAEFERRLYEKFPEPGYKPLIGMFCICSQNFFGSLEQKIKETLRKHFAAQKV